MTETEGEDRVGESHPASPGHLDELRAEEPA